MTKCRCGRASSASSPRAPGSSHRSRSPDPVHSRAAQGGCGGVSRLYSADMAELAALRDLLCPGAGSGLDRFGAALLGYDAFTGEDLPFPEGVLQAAPDWRGLTGDPRKYGFHATLKAPLSLAPGRTEAELVSACEAFAATPRAIPVITPVVGSISGFIAVIPAEPPAELIRLAADCVSEFDAFRAPLTEADRARRNPSRLTPRQREHLDRWGYPYVMDDFRFHMTLTGRVGPSGATRCWRCCAIVLPRSASHRSRSTGSRYSVRTTRIPASGSCSNTKLAPGRVGAAVRNAGPASGSPARPAAARYRPTTDPCCRHPSRSPS